eukprot:gene22822-biopygen16286
MGVGVGAALQAPPQRCRRRRPSGAAGAAGRRRRHHQRGCGGGEAAAQKPRGGDPHRPGRKQNKHNLKARPRPRTRGVQAKSDPHGGASRRPAAGKVGGGKQRGKFGARTLAHLCNDGAMTVDSGMSVEGGWYVGVEPPCPWDGPPPPPPCPPAPPAQDHFRAVVSPCATWPRPRPHNTASRSDNIRIHAVTHSRHFCGAVNA